MTKQGVLSEHTIDIVKSTAPVLAVHGEAITTKFYAMLFEAHPELLNMFNHTNQATGAQPKALAQALYAAASYVDRLEVLESFVEKTAQKHASVGVKPEHYPIVGHFLIKAMEEVLQENATADILEAWTETYGAVADIFIRAEQTLYETKEEEPKGWTGYKDFTVVDIVQESSRMKSFYLQPADHSPLPSFLSGQYVSLRCSIPGEEYTHVRSYSLSDAPGTGSYRITVKHEEEGIVSSYLHEQTKAGQAIELSAPFGSFILQTDERKPIAFISAGSGLTPLVSMLKSLPESYASAVTFIYAAKNHNHHPLQQEINSALQKLPVSQALTLYTAPEPEYPSSAYFGTETTLTREALQSALPQEDTRCYVCGPPAFVEAVVSCLHEIGRHDISTENFVPIS